MTYIEILFGIQENIVGINQNLGNDIFTVKYFDFLHGIELSHTGTDLISIVLEINKLDLVG